ncbi:MAG: hypothetical protein Q4E57_06515 [Eubacteriales bacterium]|nr:hypothetical protein [Eubacteriales bacterium]
MEETGMFGFGKKNRTFDVRLTEAELKAVMKDMSKKELKEFKRRQKEAQSDAFWDDVLFWEAMEDD